MPIEMPVMEEMSCIHDDLDLDLEGWGFFNKVVKSVVNVTKDVTKVVTKTVANAAKFTVAAAGTGLLMKRMPSITEVIRDGKGVIRCNLATSYGKLTSEAFKKMDKEMKVIIGYTIGSLAKLGTGMGWDSVIRCMNGNKLLKLKPGSNIHRTNGMSKSGGGAFKTDGSPRSSIVREVEVFFKRLVSDPDVMTDTGININTLGRMVAETGASISNFGALFYKKVNKSQTCMDVSVLRYPDLDKPYFKVYRIRLTAWRKCERFLFVQKDRSGINGVYDSVCYSPRPEIVAKLNAKVIDAAVNEAEQLFA